MKKKDFAALCDVSPSTVSHWVAEGLLVMTGREVDARASLAGPLRNKIGETAHAAALARLAQVEAEAAESGARNWGELRRLRSPVQTWGLTADDLGVQNWAPARAAAVHILEAAGFDWEQPFFHFARDDEKRWRIAQRSPAPALPPGWGPVSDEFGWEGLEEAAYLDPQNVRRRFGEEILPADVTAGGALDSVGGEDGTVARGINVLVWTRDLEAARRWKSREGERHAVNLSSLCVRLRAEEKADPLLRIVAIDAALARLDTDPEGLWRIEEHRKGKGMEPLAVERLRLLDGMRASDAKQPLRVSAYVYTLLRLRPATPARQIARLACIEAGDPASPWFDMVPKSIRELAGAGGSFDQKPLRSLVEAISETRRRIVRG